MIKTLPDGVIIAVRLTPSASRDKFDRLEVDSAGAMRLRVSVTAVPENGKANAALIKFLSKKWRLPKSIFSIISGETARNKALKISGPAENLKHLIMASLADNNLA